MRLLIVAVTPKRIFAAAGLHGPVVLLPLCFLETRLGIDDPPAITHPEYCQDFAGTAVAWQLAFLVIATNTLVMLASIVEKVTYGVSVLLLYVTARANTMTLGFGLIDLMWAILFAFAWLRTAAAEAV
jgi:hypothetical protein